MQYLQHRNGKKKKKNTVGLYPANACHLQHCNGQKYRAMTSLNLHHPQHRNSQNYNYRLQGYVY